MHPGEEDHARPRWTTSRRGQDSPWKSQSEWQRTGINGESTSIPWCGQPSDQGQLKIRSDQIRCSIPTGLSYSVVHLVVSCCRHQFFADLLTDLLWKQLFDTPQQIELVESERDTSQYVWYIGCRCLLTCLADEQVVLTMPCRPNFYHATLHAMHWSHRIFLGHAISRKRLETGIYFHWIEKCLLSNGTILVTLDDP